MELKLNLTSNGTRNIINSLPNKILQFCVMYLHFTSIARVTSAMRKGFYTVTFLDCTLPYLDARPCPQHPLLALPLLQSQPEE